MPEKMGGYDRNGWVVFTGISNNVKSNDNEEVALMIVSTAITEEILIANLSRQSIQNHQNPYNLYPL